MTHSLYTKFILGYLVFGLLGFVIIATFSSKVTYRYLVRSEAESLYDEANLRPSPVWKPSPFTLTRRRGSSTATERSSQRPRPETASAAR